ncbi:SMP-30/gluconolactonase/LRE family protein [Paenibacillus sp. GCM10023250]|uniref:SMP-30/gluconolactonase/LRE family protein n=1 Tax=Paenibacillus sp. GCM10023250 TaxID=3252648 RepID=UPI00361405B3
MTLHNEDTAPLYQSRVLTKPFAFTAGIEGPACDREGNVYAVNCERRHTIGKMTPDGQCEVFLELPDGGVGNAIRFNRAGEMIIADYVHHRLLRVDLRTREIRIFAEEPAMTQPNDLAVTGSEIWFASDPDWKRGNGRLWRIGPEGQAALLEANMGTTNGIEVSADDRTLYVNETVQRRIWSYDLDAHGGISSKRLLIQFPDFGLDGMRCDQAGNLYVTRYGEGVVAVVSPHGELLRKVELHGRNCTNLTFGGPDGRTCYVTVADTGTIECFRTEIPGRCWTLWQGEGR